MPQSILVLGGERSGKSDFAQQLARHLGDPVLFVATAEARDPEMAARIAAHRAARPATWRTVEASHDVGRAVAREAGQAQTVLVDCLTLLVSNCMDELAINEGDETLVDDSLWSRVEHEARDLLDVSARLNRSLVVVSNEVGMGLVPPYPTGRLYREVLGRVNQLVAAAADSVYLMVAGIPVDIKALARASDLDSRGLDSRG